MLVRRDMVATRRQVLGVALSILALGCNSPDVHFNSDNPARGPAELLGDRTPLNNKFKGGASDEPQAAVTTQALTGELPPCDRACRDYCAGLSLNNPLDEGVCPGLWGLGLTTQAINRDEACRRLHVDLLGVLPTRSQVKSSCGDKPWGQVVAEMLADPRFVFVQQRRWADKLRYNNEAVSVERIYDADALVRMLYEGRIAYDEFASIISAHPVLTRRYDNAGDTAEALFNLFLGRPPYEDERSDMARLYTLWGNGYYDHPALGMRLPDAVIRYQCIDDNGAVDPLTKGECTSVLWGYHELIMTPDYRSQEDELWSGLLTAEEWSALQEPGRIIASQQGFWERVVDEVLRDYLGYDAATGIPETREALVAYLLEHQGDIRALHYAIVTSQLYLQSNTGSTATDHRHTYGPLKQIAVEPWIDTIKATTGYDLSDCDHRIPDPDRMLDSDSVAAYDLVADSRWEIGERGVREDYMNLARTLGGCPDNSAFGRFTTISILTTATQEGFVARVCNASNDSRQGAAIEKLLPKDMTASKALDADTAEAIMRFQVGRFFGRGARSDEVNEARDVATSCSPKPCRAEDFARPLCYALLSSSEMLFY